jgi:DNA-binding NtrC family response regulator
MGAAILIVEDDADVSRAARVVLAPLAVRVESIANPRELDMTLAAAPIDVVLLDMNFVSGQRSGTEGLDTLGLLLRLDPTLAVVLMTAYGGVALAVDALKRGAADFVLKPWHNDKLLSSIERAVNLTRRRRQEETLQLDILERRAIERALTRHAGNVSLAAAALGLSRPALYRRMSKYGLAAE